jgi:hypothetical protein
MEFEEMQKIWDTQRHRTLYAIDEEALYRRISAKAKRAALLLNMNEIGLTIIAVVTGGILLLDAIRDQEGFWDYAGGVTFFIIAVLLLIRRRNRLRATPAVDQSLLGELEAGLAVSEQLIRLSRGFQYWFLLPVSIVTLTGMVWRGIAWANVALIVGMFLLAWGLVRWELTAKHLPRKRELEGLRDMLTQEATSEML